MMASVFKRAKTKPIPAGARIIERKAGPIAEWQDGRGLRRTAPLTKDRTGIRIESETYTVKYVDERGIERKVSSQCRDKAAALELARELEAQAMKRKKGLLDPAQERFAREARRTIAEHARNYARALAASGRTEKHVTATDRYLDKVFKEAGIQRLSELRAPVVLSIIGRMRNPPAKPDGKTRKGASLATCNAVIRALKGFSRWAWRQRITPEDVLLDLGLFNAQTDRRHVRREMSADEVRRLLNATESRTLPDHSAPGPVRAMLYRVAAATGFRRNELKSLTVDSFDLDADPPTCSVAAGYSKRRRHDVQPLPAALVEPLRNWLAGFAPGQPVFADIAEGTARMLRGDLAAARKLWIDEAGDDGAERARREESDFLQYADRHGHVADFHSLRTVYISRVVAGGASMREAQTLARHSTPVLTAHYSRATLHDVAGRVEGLGDLLTGRPSKRRPESDSKRATGTHGREVDVPQDVPKQTAGGGQKRHQPASLAICGASTNEALNQSKARGNHGKNQAEGTGFED
jgi:integrase